jgi:hypothetical protein
MSVIKIKERIKHLLEGTCTLLLQQNKCMHEWENIAGTYTMYSVL